MAQALGLVGYRITTVYDEFDARDKVSDPEIIERCREKDLIWIHADDSAKKQHGRAILTAQIRTVWVYRRDGKMSGADQLRALSYTLQEIVTRYHEYPARRHYRIREHGQRPHTKVAIEEYQI